MEFQHGDALANPDRQGQGRLGGLIVANIENVVAAHIHAGAAGVNGPVVAFLYGPAPAGGERTDGVLAQGTITADDLVGPLAGQPVAALLEAKSAGNSPASLLDHMPPLERARTQRVPLAVMGVRGAPPACPWSPAAAPRSGAPAAPAAPLRRRTART